MSLLDFFDKEKRETRKVAKAIKRLSNPYMQSEERMRHAEVLLENGSEEAIYGLLKRFTIKASNQVVDEEEKAQIYNMVVELQSDAVPAILRFIRHETMLLHPLKALTKIEDEPAVVGHLIEVLHQIGPDYIKTPERKLHLVQHLDTCADSRISEALLPFLDDHDETIRFQVVQALSERPDEACSAALFQRLLTDEDESLRVRQAICAVLTKRHFQIAEDHREELLELLPDDYRIDKQGLLTQRS